MCWEGADKSAGFARSKSMPKKRLKSIPRFQTEAEERQFWATHDTADYID